ncbi:hypothetical protein WICPIJ_003744 [Wickerhamomyces pijperi]|uniref:Uncharacterized protein n=1 Tax=Wickerhamomyces pijperi TaxID=599730 RepID=A0A9P8Q981_WICPI|nr:hypothetical protein WICPIJ_003744 [Wickerhamomyces pijperi]
MSFGVRICDWDLEGWLKINNPAFFNSLVNGMDFKVGNPARALFPNNTPSTKPVCLLIVDGSFPFRIQNHSIFISLDDTADVVGSFCELFIGFMWVHTVDVDFQRVSAFTSRTSKEEIQFEGKFLQEVLVISHNISG